MMDYASYPHQQQNTHSGYAGSGQGNTITSPSSHQHAVQSSPVLSTQQQSQGQGHNMYPPQYTVPQGGMQQVPYGMPSGIQAAAMAATAAATGSNYPYMHSDPNLPQTSPRMGGAGQKKDGRQSPRMTNVPQIPGRRLSQVTSPGVPNPQSLINHAPRPGVAPPPMPAAPAMQHPQSPEIQPGVEESPLYVNAKQFHRILKRRVARQRLEEQLRLTSKGRKPYLHESRHNHAMRRPRGPGGRFLTAEEVAAMEREGKGLDDGKVEGMSASTASVTSSGGMKRKNDDDVNPSSNKKSKTENGFTEEDEEEEDDN